MLFDEIDKYLYGILFQEETSSFISNEIQLYFEDTEYYNLPL